MNYKPAYNVYWAAERGPKEFQQTFNNFVNFESFVTKLSEIDPYEKRIT